MPDATDLYGIALDVLAGTPASLVALLQPLPREIWEWSPAEGEWTPFEMLTHMLNVETGVIPVRVRHMLVEDGAPMPRSKEDISFGTPEETLQAWRDARDANLTFLRGLTPSQLERTGAHPRYGPISAREHIIEWAYHDLEHLRQLQATIEARLYPDIGGFQALYGPPYPSGEQPS
ncbi:MAG TPA: DinB family protein [Ktedonobacterales bacterium]|nr:DinB family protein [Ktedonobacterales bacterium]